MAAHTRRTYLSDVYNRAPERAAHRRIWASVQPTPAPAFARWANRVYLPDVKTRRSVALSLNQQRRRTRLARVHSTTFSRGQSNNPACCRNGVVDPRSARRRRSRSTQLSTNTSRVYVTCWHKRILQRFSLTVRVLQLVQLEEAEFPEPVRETSYDIYIGERRTTSLFCTGNKCLGAGCSFSFFPAAEVVRWRGRRRLVMFAGRTTTLPSVCTPCRLGQALQLPRRCGIHEDVVNMACTNRDGTQNGKWQTSLRVAHDDHDVPGRGARNCRRYAE